MATTDFDAGTVTKKVVKASAGTLSAIWATNIGASLRWFQLHDKATDPAGTNVPIIFWPLGAGTAAQPALLEITTEQLAGFQEFTNGVAWAISTTPGTFTDSATANEHTVVVRRG